VDPQLAVLPVGLFFLFPTADVLSFAVLGWPNMLGFMLCSFFILSKLHLFQIWNGPFNWEKSSWYPTTDLMHDLGLAQSLWSHVASWPDVVG